MGEVLVFIKVFSQKSVFVYKYKYRKGLYSWECPLHKRDY